MDSRSTGRRLGLCLTACVCAWLAAAAGLAEAQPDSPETAFVGSYEFGAGPGAQSVVIADVDRDGYADIVVANSESDDVSILFGIPSDPGFPEFDAPYNVPVLAEFGPSGPAAVAVADVNRDSLPDIVVALESANQIAVIKQTSARTFAAGAFADTGMVPYGLVVADLNHDGKLDAVTCNSFEDPGTVSVLRGRGDGTFQPHVQFDVIPAGSALETGAVALVAADVNNDSNLDLIVANDQGSNVAILLGYGDGTFAEAGNIELGSPALSPVAVAVGDLNIDGKPDIVTANEDGFNISVLLGRGDGAFVEAPNSPVEVGSLPAAVAVWDFNLDGRPDVAVANTPLVDAVSVLRGNGDGTFQEIEDFDITGEGPISLATGDLDGDHKRDLVTANFDAGTPEEDAVSVLSNDGDLFLGDSDLSGDLTAADVDGVDGEGRPVGAIAELFDGDGSSVITVAGGTALSGPGVDGNGDEIVNAADIVAIATIVAGGAS